MKVRGVNIHYVSRFSHVAVPAMFAKGIQYLIGTCCLLPVTSGSACINLDLCMQVATVAALMSSMRGLIILLAAIVTAEGARYSGGTTCSTSQDCGTGSCCRDEKNVLLDPSMKNAEIGLSTNRGTCKAGSAQLKEVCSSRCQCAPGLVCYTPVSGVCCPANRCETQEYVDQMKKYWDNCAPPLCFFPARK
ncbi:uncharacterized protein [Haliotis asinina]|uniref:uncharacterized protein n=1 Tax=Haliotis asinina TaxID=109174 RepID=UPI0035326566